jgi:hypothetical protein
MNKKTALSKNFILDSAVNKPAEPSPDFYLRDGSAGRKKDLYPCDFYFFYHIVIFIVIDSEYCIFSKLFIHKRISER